MSSLNYGALIRQQPKLIGFGLLCIFLSSFGQTFFVALSGDKLRATFGLSHGTFGAVYSAATLTSAALLTRVGSLIDSISLTAFAIGVTIALTGACSLMGLATGLSGFYLALFGLRLAGQGLMTHTASTTMARYFDSERGKALSIGALGYPIGEAILPSIVTPVIKAHGYPIVWFVSAGFVFIVGTPLLAWLSLGNVAERDTATTATNNPTPSARSWTRAEVIRDPAFYMMLWLWIGPAFICTGYYFHIAHIAEVSGWSMQWVALCFTLSALCRVTSGLVVGPLVDRFSATRMIVPSQVPLVAVIAALIVFQGSPMALVMLVGFGLSLGASGSISSALFAELYGTLHLGSIRALVMAIVVLSTAISPVVFGWLFDQEVSVAVLSALTSGYLVVAAALFVIGLRSRNP